jgi:peptide/nickel transport system substrate-binding protein
LPALASRRPPEVSSPMHMRFSLLLSLILAAGILEFGALSSARAAEDTLVEPFDAPPLAEIDAKAKWEDQPVLDGMQLLRKYQAGEKPLATTAEALSLVNDSTEANAKILSALGRLPANDADVNWDATITRYFPGDARSTNPIMFSSTSESEIGSLTSFGMFSFDWELKPFAAREAVKSWQSSADRMVDKVVMRDDLVWSDGKPITAYDVAFSFQTIMNPKIPVPAVRSGTDELRWVQAYDDHTVVFFHKAPLATNVWNINYPIIPKHIYENSIKDDPTLQDSAYHVKYENDPVCGGPYRIVSRVRGQEIVLERRDDYYLQGGKTVRTKPYFKRIRFRVIQDTTTALLALKSGEIDEMILSPEQWQTQTQGPGFYEHNTKARGTEWVYYYFGWNCKSAYFSDQRVRVAMSYSFDYNELLNKLCYGLYEPSNGIFYPTSWMAPKTPLKPYQQDLDKAEQLLDEAGWTDHDGDGVRDKEIDGVSRRFEFSILCNNAPLPIAICSLLKDNLDQIGIVCNVRPLEFTVLQDKNQKHEFDATMAGWGTGTDPDTTDNIFVTGAGRNYGQYSNPEVDRLYQAGKKEFDREKRAAIYAKIDELLYADQPYTWLYFRSSFYAFNKDLRGYKYSPRGPFHYSPGFSSIWRAAE